MRYVNDLEIVAIMIGDIELFMPGLYQMQRAEKGKNKGSHFLNICLQLLPKIDNSLVPKGERRSLEERRINSSLLLIIKMHS